MRTSASTPIASDVVIGPRTRMRAIFPAFSEAYAKDITPMDTKTGSPAFIILSAADIAERAYQLYLARGRADGFDREDWLRAEHELKAPRREVTPARSEARGRRSRS